ncbi:MAG: ketoacyl-ACP synthase III [Saprospirales bacterium]|nr:MAG: ketoacyl-ACP synthase III [Saprospirales bacterium]
MNRTKIAGIGHYVPERIVTNAELEVVMDTSDEWIIERTGIEERRFGERFKENTTILGAKAARKAIENAGIEAEEIDFIIFATLSPDYFFPGCGVLLQRELGITSTEIGALDVRNQCSGFVYGMSIADQFIKTGHYKNILLVGAEMHSMGLDFTTRGRNVSVIFGDGAGAVVLQPSREGESSEILTTHLHADGTYAEELAFINPGAHGGVHGNKDEMGYSENKWDPIFITQKMLDDGMTFPYMNGQLVFKTAVKKFPEVIMKALNTAGKKAEELKLVVPHQANLRISQFVQRMLRLRDDQVFSNIQKYGNTTAASIPIALSEAVQQGVVQRGDLVCLAAFGSGFTWGSVLLTW